MKREYLRLYAVTKFDTTCKQIEEAIQGGATMIQLREKHLTKIALIDKARQVNAVCKRYDVPLIINDFVDIALEVGADGVHVGIDDESVANIRKRTGKDFIIGATAKTVEQAKLAEKSGADYIGVGAVFPSSTKQNAIRITKEQLKEICESVNIPAVAIGGINLDNIAELINTGVSGVAVVSAIFDAKDIKKATQNLVRTYKEGNKYD